MESVISYRYMKSNKFACYDVPIPHKLILLAKSAGSQYLEDMEKNKNQKRKEEMERRNKQKLELEKSRTCEKETIQDDCRKLSEMRGNVSEAREKAAKKIAEAKELLATTSKLEAKANALEKTVTKRKKTSQTKGILKFLRKAE